MKKSLKVLASLAVCAVTVVVAFSGCESKGTPMTEEDVATVTSAFQTMSTYNEGYTVKETTDLTIDYDGYDDYDSALNGTAFVTYDAVNGTMGYGATISATNMLEAMAMSAVYYTFKTEEGYKQYQSISYMGIESKTCETYTSTDYIDLYYTDFASCISEILNIDLADAAKIITVDDLSLFWQEALDESIDLMASAYGINLKYEAGECTTTEKNGQTVYHFAATASAGKVYMGVEILDDLSYTVDITLDTSDETSVKISSIKYDVTQNLSLTQDSETIKATGKSTIEDVFSYSYDPSLIPDNFDDYEAEE